MVGSAVLRFAAPFNFFSQKEQRKERKNKKKEKKKKKDDPASTRKSDFDSIHIHVSKTMKAALAAAAITLAAQPYATLAFAHPPSATSTLKYGSMSATPLRATLTADELSTKSKQEQCRILGVEEEKLALGIDPDEVLDYGT